MSVDVVEVLQAEQKETSKELAELLRLAQQMGRRLENETHGGLYDDVRRLVVLLHQARTQADEIQDKLSAQRVGSHST